MLGLSLVVVSGGHSSSRCAGLSLSRPLLLRSTGSSSAGSVVVAHGPSCSVACGIFPDQGSNPCPQHWQADSQPLRHQGSPKEQVLKGYVQHNTVNVNLTHKQYNFWFMVYTHNIQYKNTNGEDASQQPSSREKEETRIKKAEGTEGFGYI